METIYLFNFSEILLSLLVSLHEMCIGVGGGGCCLMYHGTCVEVRGRLCGVGSVLQPLGEFQGLNSG